MATFLCYGNFNGKYGDKFSYDILYDILEQNIAENYSLVRFYGYIRSWGYTASGSTARCYINGQEIGTFTSITANQYSEIGRLDVKVKHNDDGTGSTTVTGLCDTPWTIGDASCSGTRTLPDIPRASTVSATSGNIEENINITINSASSSFKHTLYYTFGNSGDIVFADDVTTSPYVWQISSSLYAQIPNSKQGTGTITCITRRIDNNQEIGRNSCQFTAYVNEDRCRPLVTATVTEVNKTLTTGYTTQQLTGSANKFIKGVSDATISLSATPRNSATIKNYYVRLDNDLYAEQSHNYYKINNNQFFYTVMDSRDIYTDGSTTVDMVNYIPLTAVVHVYRPLPTTGEVKIDVRGNYFNGSFGAENNILKLAYRFKEKGTSTWNDFTYVTANISGNTYSYSASLGTGFDYKKEYDFEIFHSDLVIAFYTSLLVSKGLPTFFIGKDRIESNGQQILVPYTLYENASGSNGTITLSDNKNNYKRIKIDYIGNWGTSRSLEINCNDGNQNIDLTNVFQTSTSGTMQLETRRYSIDGNAIAPAYGNGVYTNIDAANGSLIGGNQTTIYIIKVTGYK